MDKLKLGAISDGARFLLAGMITGALVKANRIGRETGGKPYAKEG